MLTRDLLIHNKALKEPVHAASKVLSAFKGVIGLYSFWDCETCVYVGKSDDLEFRLNRQIERFRLKSSHVVIQPITETNDLSFHEIKEYLRAREAILIYWESPIENMQRPKFWPLNRWSKTVQKKLIKDLLLSELIL